MKSLNIKMRKAQIVRNAAPDVCESVRVVLPAAGEIIALTEHIVGAPKPWEKEDERAALTILAARIAFVSENLSDFLTGSGLLLQPVFDRASAELRGDSYE